MFLFVFQARIAHIKMLLYQSIYIILQRSVENLIKAQIFFIIFFKQITYLLMQ